MYIKFTDETRLKHNTQYLCVIKGYRGKYYYAVLTWYIKAGVVIKYEFTGEGFYDYDSEYGYCKRNDVIAYRDIDEYIE